MNNDEVKLRCLTRSRHKAWDCGKAKRKDDHNSKAILLSVRIQVVVCKAITPNTREFQYKDTCSAVSTMGERTVVRLRFYEISTRDREALSS